MGFAEPATPERGARTHGWLFALADGVGGHDDGEVASRAGDRASDASGFRKAPPKRAAGRAADPAGARSQLARVRNRQTASAGGSNMATTMVACALRYDRVAVAHAGDSRCYLIRDGFATLLTRDHTVANEQLELGILSAKESATSHQPPHAGAVSGQSTCSSTSIWLNIRCLPGMFWCCARTGCTTRWRARKWRARGPRRPILTGGGAQAD